MHDSRVVVRRTVLVELLGRRAIRERVCQKKRGTVERCRQTWNDGIALWVLIRSERSSAARKDVGRGRLAEVSSRGSSKAEIAVVCNPSGHISIPYLRVDDHVCISKLCPDLIDVAGEVAGEERTVHDNANIWRYDS